MSRHASLSFAVMLCLCIATGLNTLADAQKAARDPSPDSSIFGDRPAARATPKPDAPIVQSPPGAPLPEAPVTPPPERDPDPVAPPAESTRVTPKAPVPDAAALKAYTKLLNELYGKKISAARTSQDKTALAKGILKTGREEEKDSVARFAILTLARDTAAEAGDVETAFEAIDELGKSYAIDVAQMKVETAGPVAKSLRTAKGLAGFIVKIDPIIEQFDAVDRYDSARQLAEMEMAAARHVNDRGLLQEATARSAKVKAAEASYAGAKKALVILEHDPANPDAKLVVGKFHCFAKGDWEHGLPLLSGGSDAALKHAAGLEAIRPTSPEEQYQLADAWWAAGQGELGAVKWQILSRAAEWYAKAIPNLVGIKKLGAMKKVQEFQSLPRPGGKFGHELVTLAQGDIDRKDNGAVVLHEGERIHTVDAFTPPVAFRIVTMTDSANIRIKYAADEIIFNWEGNMDELRVGGGPASGRHKGGGAGRVPVNTWVQIDLVVLPDAMIISVDGKERYRTSADFSQVDMPFWIFPAGSTIKVKSIVATKPAGHD